MDAGKSCRSIKNALAQFDCSLENLDALLLTHSHSDHTKGTDMLCRKAPTLPVYLTDACSRASVFDSRTLPHLHTITPDSPFSFGDRVRIIPFSLPHDSGDCVGYRIETPIATLGFATDIGYPTQSMMSHLLGCDYVLLESNHDIERLQNGPYPYPLKQRILSKGGHLSNADAARCAVHLAQNGTKHILLAHLSEENNTPALARTATADALLQAGVTTVKVDVASPCESVCLVDIDL